MISPSIRKPIEELGLHGVLRALETQYSSNEFDDLSYEERLEHLFTTQVEEVRNRAMTRRVKQARLRFPNACTENIEFGGERSGHKKLLLSLLTGN